MPQETLDSLSKLGLGGVAIGALLYIVILLIKYISKFAQKHVDAMSALVVSNDNSKNEIKTEIKIIQEKLDRNHQLLIKRKAVKI